MRRTIAFVLGAGIAVALLPASPAAASCIWIDESTCVNLCIDVDSAYQRLDATLGDALPDRQFYCLD